MARRLVAAGVIRTAGGKTLTTVRTQDDGRVAVSGRIVPTPRAKEQRQ